MLEEIPISNTGMIPKYDLLLEVEDGIIIYKIFQKTNSKVHITEFQYWKLKQKIKLSYIIL